MNLGGYVSQPPFMFTTLEAARTFKSYFEGGNVKAPISVIRVRVAGATGPDELSLERIRSVGEQIRERTGLTVDITAGSSPKPLDIELPAGDFDRPTLTIQEGWVKKGVSVAILNAVDRKSLVLFALVLVSCGFFLANGALASARSRRSEIGTLLSLGWSRSEVFRLVIMEVGVVGLVAGLVGSLMAAGLIGLLSLDLSMAYVLLVPPVAVLTAVIAAVVPAWRASRVAPIDAVHPSISEHSFNHAVRSRRTLVIANLRRVPGRTLLGATGLFVGVVALTILVSVNLAFQGTLVGTLLGNVLSIRVRGVDVLSVALVIGLGALAVADVLFLNIRERAGELGSLRAAGWADRELATIVALEGTAIGILGAVPGAIVGVMLAWGVTGFDLDVALAGAVAAVAGVVIALAGALVPAAIVNRITPAAVLAEEE